MVVHKLRLQKASSPDGFSVEWIDTEGNPVFELFRKDDNGERRVLFGADETLVDVDIESFLGLINESVETLDRWEADQRALGFIDDQGKRIL